MKTVFYQLLLSVLITYQGIAPYGSFVTLVEENTDFNWRYNAEQSTSGAELVNDNGITTIRIPNKKRSLLLMEEKITHTEFDRKSLPLGKLEEELEIDENDEKTTILGDKLRRLSGNILIGKRREIPK